MRGVAALDLVNALTLLLLAGVVGMVVYANYKRKGKIAEATHSLSVIAQTAAEYYNASDPVHPDLREFPPSSSMSVPSSLDYVRAKRYRSSPADWDASPWKELRFNMPEPQCYAYSFVAQGKGPSARATAIAKGDLDGDGKESTFSITIAPEGGRAKPAATIDKTDPDE
jgi:hypothetical protein